MAHFAAAAGLLLMLLSLPRVADSMASGPHITDLNVLLPPRMTNPVPYRLQGSDGCFSWSWDHHDILSVQPEYNGSSRCSTSAQLISVAPYTGRKETAVYATDLRSGTVIRCEVFIDKISRIQIFHHSVKLDLDGLATLRIRAFDDEENVFSSLVGLQFLWQLVPKSFEADSVHHLVHVPLKETPLSDCGGFCGDLDTQIALEDSGVGSDLYVVKGTGIGHEFVTARLLEPQLEHLVDKIILTVAEAMSLDPPSPVYVTVGALIHYSLRVIRQNTPQVIDLPSPHHRWSVFNSSVAEIDSMMGIAHALNLGITDIIVEDTRVAGHVQTSSMHVVIPDKLCLYIIPVTNAFDPLEGTKPTTSSAVWYVFPGQQYIIDMKVFSQGSDAGEIYITQNNNMVLESNSPDMVLVSNDVAVMYGWRNSRFLKPISPGLGSLTASLTYHRGSSEIAEVLKVLQEVIVCNKVKLTLGETDEYSQIIYLPWAPGVHQEVELKATGGCGKTLEDYNWFSSDVATVSVPASGLIRAKRPGQATIKVVSVFDPINYDEVVVEVSIPSSMVMLPNFPVEVVVGTQLQAAVTLKASNGNYYYRCDTFGSFVKWKVFSVSESFRVINTTGNVPDFDILPHMEVSKPLYGRPCAGTYLYASAAGRAMLHATLSSEFQFSDRSDGPAILKTVLLIAAYPPLVIHQAGNGNQFGGYWVDLTRKQDGIHDSDYTNLDELYLVPGSSMDVQLLGGPERWGQGVEYIERVDILDEKDLAVTDGVLLKQASSSGGTLYRVFCQTLGNFKVLFSRGNLVGDDHPMPAVANTELIVICSFPSSITLIANEPANTPDIIEDATKADRGPGRIRTSPVIVANGCTIRMAAVGIYRTGRSFANSSSLCLRWDLSGCEELARWIDTNSFEKSASTWERFLVLQNASGLCTVRATVIGFSETMASHLHSKAYLLLESEENTLTDAVRLQLVSSLRVVPESILIVFDSEAKANLSITGGTCFLDVGVNDTHVAEIRQPPESVQCSWLMICARGLGTALVTVRDIGLSPPAAASSLVKVANVDWIKINSQEEISLMEGTIKAFDIVAGTHDGSVFDSSQYVYMNIHVHIEDGILELVNKTGSSIIGGQKLNGPQFSVRAANLGITTLYVSITQLSGHEVLSQLIKVEVYEPLRMHPEYVFLVPGASYTLVVKGGPKTGATVEYTSMHDETATVQGSSGRLSAISIGNTTVRAIVYVNGDMLICEAYGRVEVGIPSAMILNLQSDLLCIGCTMPIFPSFPEGDLFSFYEVCKDYKWMLEDEKVLSFQLARTLHSDGNDNGFINVLYGRSAGRTKISISFSCDFVSSGTPQTISYNASETLRVVSDPPLALGMQITWLLPPFYTTSDILPASSESYGQLDSHNRKRSTIYSLLKACGKNDLLKEDGIAIDGSKIKTKENNNLACIQAKDQTTGRTEIASCVRVAEVEQVRVTAKESLLHVAYLAVHDKIELITSYCDGLGYPFYEAHGVVSLDVETNYPDVVSILVANADNKQDGNGNVFLQARNPGRALVRISINHNPNKADYILVSVGTQLLPRNPVLHVGRYLNFTIIGDGIGGLALGHWLSGNGSVLSVNRISGEAHARGEGATQVSFEGSNMKLQTTVTVLKVGQIIVDAPAETLTNVPFPTKGYKFSVRFSDPKFEAAGNRIEVPYDCKVDPPFVGYANPWCDRVSGTSYCLFFPHSPKHLLSSESKSKAMRSENSSGDGEYMFVSIIASLREAPHVMGTTNAIFIGGFLISEGRKLNLTPNFNKSLITVMGNTDVEIDWNRKDLLSVSPRSKYGFGVWGLTDYEVKVLIDKRFTDKLSFVLPTTGQTEEIDVSYEPGERTTTAGTSRFMWAAVLMCILVLVLTVVIFIRLLERPERSPPSRRRSTAPTSVAAPVAPDHTPAYNARSSPQTPQPFVEYVRRTIDETPYYKREGRRRFDPQYTY